MADKFSGKWAFDRSEGMESIVAALKLPADKVPKSGQTSLEYKIDGNSYTLRGTHPKSGKETTITFTIGEKFKAEELSAFLGKDVYATPSWNGSQLVVEGDGGQGKLVREVIGNELHTTFTFAGATGKRIFKRA